MFEAWRRVEKQMRDGRDVRRRGRELRRAGRMHAGELSRIGVGTGDFLRDRAAPVVVSVVRDEMLRLPFFLDHHRSLGFAGFLIVDNASTDGTTEFLARQRDVVLHTTSASYAAATTGVDWQQHLIREFALERWALIADADEQLVFPGDREEGIRALIARAEASGDEAVMAPLVDVYPAVPLRDAIYRSGQTFLSVADRFDGPESHYLRAVQPCGRTRHVEVRGGVRLRTMDFALAEAPLLTKFPFARRRRRVAVESAHLLHPPAMNRTSTFAALLHFKYFHDFAARAEWGASSGEHWHDGYEYRKYRRAIERNPSIGFVYEGSRRYRGPESLDWLWNGIRCVQASGASDFVRANDLGP